MQLLMGSPNKSQIVCSTGLSIVVDAYHSLDQLWENHFALLKNMMNEMAVLKESGCSRPLTTPIKVTSCNIKPRAAPKLPSADNGRITRSMMKKVASLNDNRVSHSSSGSEFSARQATKAKKDAVNQDVSAKENEPAIKDIKVKGQMKVRIEDLNDRHKNEDDVDLEVKSKKVIKSENVPALLCPPANEWLTDDEDSFKSPLTEVKSSGKKGGAKKSRKRKSTQYFTPSCPTKSVRRTRAAARAEAKHTESASKTRHQPCHDPGSTKKSPRKANLPPKAPSSSSSSITPQTNSGTSSTTMKSGSRVPSRGTTPDTKSLTDSAAKRRKEEEEKRRLQWEQLIQKEQKALMQKQENLKQKQLSSKLKNEEKKKRIERAKEIKEREMEEKKMKEQEKLEDIERRRKEKVEARRLESLRHREMLKKRQKEIDLRKQGEEEDRKNKLLMQEQIFRKKQEEIERKRKEESEVFKLIREHNAAIKAPIPKLQQCSNSLVKDGKALAELTKNNELVTNETFTFKKEKTDEDTLLEKDPKPHHDFKIPTLQPMTPEKSRSLENYDITDIKSDDGTDDDEMPRKPIPSWAKSENLLIALDQQFSISMRKREQRVREIFGQIRNIPDLEEIFKGFLKPCNPRYEKRTSSAVWGSPLNTSSYNYSMYSEK